MSNALSQIPIDTESPGPIEAQPAETKPPAASIPTSLAWGVLVTVSAWNLLWIAFVIVALRAESLQNVHRAKPVVWTISSVMVFLGMVIAIVALDQLGRAHGRLLGWISTGIWMMAMAIAAGSFISRPHHWPWPEIGGGLLLAIIAKITIAIIRRSKSPNSKQKDNVAPSEIPSPSPTGGNGPE